MDAKTAKAIETSIANALALFFNKVLSVIDTEVGIDSVTGNTQITAGSGPNGAGGGGSGGGGGGGVGGGGGGVIRCSGDFRRAGSFKWGSSGSVGTGSDKAVVGGGSGNGQGGGNGGGGGGGGFTGLGGSGQGSGQGQGGGKGQGAGSGNNAGVTAGSGAGQGGGEGGGTGSIGPSTDSNAKGTAISTQ